MKVPFNYTAKIKELFESTKLFSTFFSEQRVRLELTVVDYKSTGLPINRPMQLKLHRISLLDNPHSRFFCSPTRLNWNFLGALIKFCRPNRGWTCICNTNYEYRSYQDRSVSDVDLLQKPFRETLGSMFFLVAVAGDAPVFELMRLTWHFFTTPQCIFIKSVNLIICRIIFKWHW